MAGSCLQWGIDRKGGGQPMSCNRWLTIMRLLTCLQFRLLSKNSF